MRYFGQREKVGDIVSFCNVSDIRWRERERELPVVPGTETATGSTVNPRSQKGLSKSPFLNARDRICFMRHYHAKPKIILRPARAVKWSLYVLWGSPPPAYTSALDIVREVHSVGVVSMNSGQSAPLLPVYKAVAWRRRLEAGFPLRRPGFDPRSNHVGYMVDKLTRGQVSSEYFGFPYQLSFHQMPHTRVSSGAGTTGQLVTEVPSGLSLTPPQNNYHSVPQSGHLSQYSDGLRPWRAGFDCQQGKIFLFSTLSNPTLGLRQPPIHGLR
jgi:hypothetical protein